MTRRLARRTGHTGAAADAFPKAVAAYEPLTIKWEVSEDQKNWFPAGSTKTPVYVLFAAPTEDPVDEGRTSTEAMTCDTVLALGCRAAAGLSDKDKVVAAIWKNFSGKALKDATGTPLTYWKTWLRETSPGKYVNPAKDVYGLLKTKDGMCGAVADLFRFALLAQGIDVGTRTVVRPKKDGEMFLVGLSSWSFGKAQNGKEDGYLYRNTVTDMFQESRDGDPQKKSQYVNTKNNAYLFDLGMKKNVPLTDVPYVGQAKTPVGQNNPSPYATFDNHVVVQIGTKLYDPSYGAVYDSLADMQKKAIAGFYTLDTEKGPDDGFVMNIRKPGDKLGLVAQKGY